jgi:hypothetical protein
MATGIKIANTMPIPAHALVKLNITSITHLLYFANSYGQGAPPTTQRKGFLGGSKENVDSFLKTS